MVAQPTMSTLNGQVSDIYQRTGNPMIYDRVEPKGQPEHFADELTKGVIGPSKVGELFFSSMNMDALQDGIRYGVYKKSCDHHVIGRQSDDELKVIMRSIYAQYSKNQPFNIVEQVRELNAKVLDYCVNNIVQELNMYVQYRKDKASLPVPLDRGQNESIKGLRTNEFKSF